ncbi:tyrosine-type recombinase/integrase [Saccharothrix sp. NRRL B-16348]|uniref:tyrosine-type recombinase/integrase n=1 Tax=Saccharothrix sp. NRRL B-16348 TaxID=1415542 RepID=UPI0006B04B66|nr:tyrosine-type recombinase/integrase [Saccharothrix sp. NRRL B-16348]
MGSHPAALLAAGCRTQVVTGFTVVESRGDEFEVVTSPDGSVLLAEYWRGNQFVLAAARRTGSDPMLDALLLRFPLETAARTGGALALRARDLDPDQSLVRLREKGSTQRWQPMSPTLMEHLLHHARDRGVRDENDKVLRYANGAPLTLPHYEWLWHCWL